VKLRWSRNHWPLLIALMLGLWVFGSAYAGKMYLFVGHYDGYVIFPLFLAGLHPLFIILTMFAIPALGLYWGRKRGIGAAVVLVPLFLLNFLLCPLCGLAVLTKVERYDSIRVGAHTYQLAEVTETDLDGFPTFIFVLYECDQIGIVCRPIYSHNVNASDNVYANGYFRDVEAMEFALYFDRASDTLQVRTDLGVLFVLDDVTSAEPAEIQLPDVQRIAVENADRVIELAQMTRGTISQVAWTPDGTHLAVGGEVVGRIVLQPVGVWMYDVAALAQPPHLIAINERGKGGNFRSALSVAFSPDGGLLAAGSGDYSVRVWDTTSGQEVLALDTRDNDIDSIVFDPTGTRLAYKGWYDEVWIYDLQRMKVADVLSPEKSVLSFALRPDGSALAAGTWGNIYVWSLQSPSVQRVFDTPTDNQALAFTPDGAFLASIEAGGLSLRDSESGRIARVLAGYDDNIACLAFNREGSILASGNYDGVIRLWSVSEGDLLVVLQGHERKVKSLAFNPAGSMLASTSSDGTIRLWGVPSEPE
jgi:WD40 repeat protein